MINTYIHFYLYVLYVYLTYVYISKHIVVSLLSPVIIKRIPRFYSFFDMYRNLLTLHSQRLWKMVLRKSKSPKNLEVQKATRLTKQEKTRKNRQEK